jgi:CubicO group peptidase (beta-lactamase class C family)
MRTALLSLVALLLGATAAHAQETAPPKSVDELRQRIEKIVKESNTPAIGIALVNKDGPYWVAGWGKADIKSGRTADENTLFRIGSISKMFAAFAVLKLAEEGKLSLQDKLRDRAPEVVFVNPWDDTHPVRIVHLLEHTTGWDDTHMPEYAFEAPDSMDVKQGLDFHPDSRTSRWPPGTRHSYCNSGAGVVAYIVEKVTGQRYEDYIEQNFFKPLGMTSTSYFKTPAYDQKGATLYIGNVPQDYWHIIYRAAGSINSSAVDMAKLVQFLLRRGAAADARILAEASIDRMEVPQSTPGNAAGITSGYGLANYAVGHKALGLAFHGHNGGVNGGLSELAYVNEIGEGYVFMINSGNGAALGRISELLKDYLLRGRQQPQATASKLPEQFKNIDGYYVPINPRVEKLRFLLGLSAIFKVTHDDQFLHRSPIDGNWISSDGVASNGALIDGWLGLPSIAVVQDPLAGPALQVHSDTLQRVPGWLVFLKFFVMIAVLAMFCIGIVALIVWGVRRTRKKTVDDRLMMRLWPIIATVLLAVFLISFFALSGSFELAGTVSALSVAVLLLSLAYPALVLLGVVQLLKPATRANKNLPYWFAAAFVLVHVLIAGYLGAYGVLGIRSWS